jgi:hypothetical protein
MTSTTSPEEEEEILYVSLPNLIGCSMLAYQEGSLLPDVLLSQLLLLLLLLLLSPSLCLMESLIVFVCGSTPLESIMANVINVNFYFSACPLKTILHPSSTLILFSYVFD